MPRRKPSSSPPPDAGLRIEDAAEELGVLVQRLTGETKVLREAIDDLRVEVEWLARNLLQARWSQPPPTAPVPVVVADDPHVTPTPADVDDHPPSGSATASAQGSLFD